MITVYTIAYNEEVILPHLIRHYRLRFPDCPIVVFDNFSTDKTVEIALKNNCVVIPFASDGLRDDIHVFIKDNCWKNWPVSGWIRWDLNDENFYLNNNLDVKIKLENGEISSGLIHFLNFGYAEARKIPGHVTNFGNGSMISNLYPCKTEWCIVTDCDEFLDVDQTILKNANFNIVNAQWIHMHGEDGNVDKIDSGVELGAKICMWKPSEINDISFAPGQHAANPSATHGNIITFNQIPINLLHFKDISLEYVLQRFKTTRARLSSTNIKNGWGIHYSYPDSAVISFRNWLKENKVKVR